MPGHLVEEGERVSLRTITPGDLPVIWRLFGDYEVRRFLGLGLGPVYPEDEEEWYRAVRQARDRFDFAVVAGEKLVGVASVHRVDWRARVGGVGYWLGREYWGRGYGTEAVSLLVRHAFRWLGLEKLWARVYEPNVASRRVLEKNGFRLAGRLRRHVYAPGIGVVDLLLYELLREEWAGSL